MMNDIKLRKIHLNNKKNKLVVKTVLRLSADRHILFEKGIKELILFTFLGILGSQKQENLNLLGAFKSAEDMQ